MKRALHTSSLILVALSLVAAGCGSSSGDLSKADTQRRFGVRMAKMNLWREAMFRFRRATEIEPQDAMSHNNLAVALEATGDFDAAAKEYREALRLDRSNEYIQKNYSRFVEFTQRGKKRAPAAATAAKTPAAAPAAATPAAMPPAVTPPDIVPPDTVPPMTPPATDTATTARPPQEGSR